MKATGNFEAARDVDPQVVLSDKTRAHIDHWLTKFPPDRKRSAVLQGLHAAQEQNQGWLTDELIVGVAKYLELPPVWAYEVASFYSMFETERVGRHNVAFCTNISCWLNGAEDLLAHAEEAGLQAGPVDGRWPRLPQARRRVPGCLLRSADDGHQRPLSRAPDERKVDALLDGLE